MRVYIDWPEGQDEPGGKAAVAAQAPDEETRAFDGIGVEDCERVSRELSALLDVEDPIAVPYTAGSVVARERTGSCARQAHYRRFVGERVHVELVAPRDGRRRYTGDAGARG